MEEGGEVEKNSTKIFLKAQVRNTDINREKITECARRTYAGERDEYTHKKDKGNFHKRNNKYEKS